MLFNAKSTIDQIADKPRALRRMKYWATGLLLLVSGLFALSFLLPNSPWVRFMQAVLEAAMVGALADWFAVVALFRRIPIPVIGRHSAIIPKNKDKIADNLAVFVRDKFLDAESLVRLLQQQQVAQTLSQWLLRPASQARLGNYFVRWVGGMLAFCQEEPMHRLLQNAIRSLLARIDLAPAAGAVLDTLTQAQRHQALLDEVIHQLAELLANAETQALLANGLGGWFKEEYPLVEKLVSAEWIGTKGAALTIAAASRLLDDINRNPEHPLRARFDAFTKEQIARLKTSAELRAKGEAIKDYIQHDPIFTAYIREIWGSVQAWLVQDLAQPDSQLHGYVQQGAAWLGQVIQDDPSLQESLNQHVAELAQQLAPDFADFLTQHIRNTIQGWDSQTLSQQIEWNIGRDLQFIRINGTVIGGLIGGVLYLLSLLSLTPPGR